MFGLCEIFKHAHLKFTVYGRKQASKQTSKHTHVRNAVTLMWGSLRLAPIIYFATFYLLFLFIKICPIILKIISEYLAQAYPCPPTPLGGPVNSKEKSCRVSALHHSQRRRKTVEIRGEGRGCQVWSMSKI